MYKNIGIGLIIVIAITWIVIQARWPIDNNKSQRIAIDSLLLVRADSIIKERDRAIDSMILVKNKIETRYETIIISVDNYDKHDIDSFISARYILH